MSYHPAVGRFLQRDPLGYVDGMNAYQTERADPLSGLDPAGLMLSAEGKALWQAALAYAISHGWGVSTLVLTHFLEVSTNPAMPGGVGSEFGPPLDLSGTVASQKIGKIEGPKILDAIKSWIGAAATCGMGKTTQTISGSYSTEYAKKFDPDLFFSLHNINIKWSAKVEIGPSEKPADGCKPCTVPYRIVEVQASFDDDFDFNPGQFSGFPFGNLNNAGVEGGVPFHISGDLSGFGWATNGTVQVGGE